MGKSWTQKAPLPGGNFAINEKPILVDKLLQEYSFLDKPWAQSLITRYGTRAWKMLANSSTLSDMGE